MLPSAAAAEAAAAAAPLNGVPAPAPATGGRRRKAALGGGGAAPAGPRVARHRDVEAAAEVLVASKELLQKLQKKLDAAGTSKVRERVAEHRICLHCPPCIEFVAA